MQVNDSADYVTNHHCLPHLASGTLVTHCLSFEPQGDVIEARWSSNFFTSRQKFDVSDPVFPSWLLHVQLYAET